MTRAAGRAVLTSSRAPFLALTPVCVLLGCATALGQGASPDAALLAGVLLNALLAHASVNLLNEYHDFRSGLDLHTRRTPFSGGSGGLPAHPAMAGAVLRAGLLGFVLSAAMGLYFVALRGAVLLIPGLLGLLLIAGYTPWINRRPWLCLVAPGLGIGLTVVLGTHLAAGGTLSVSALLAAGMVFALGNNLLLMNQYPDTVADQTAGRRNFPIVYGIGKSNTAYGIFSLVTAGSVAFGAISGVWPPAALWALAPWLLSLAALAGMIRFGHGIGAHAGFLAANVAAALLTPLTLGMALLSAR
jgi:1,4-dihydroxy-2-naphthoate octaprenyltransferase